MRCRPCVVAWAGRADGPNAGPPTAATTTPPTAVTSASAGSDQRSPASRPSTAPASAAHAGSSSAPSPGCTSSSDYSSATTAATRSAKRSSRSPAASSAPGGCRLIVIRSLRSWDSSSACGRCRPHILERNPSLFTQRGEVEVDLLAGHQPLPERHDVGERHREGAPTWSDAKPVATAGPAQRSPHCDHIVAESHGLVLRSEVRECGEELELVRRSHGVPAVASEAEWRRLKETVGYEGLEDRVDVASRFRFAVSLEETKHLGAVHGHFGCQRRSLLRRTRLPDLLPVSSDCNRS